MSSRYLDLARRAIAEETRTEGAPLRLPGREPERPCLACGRQCPEAVLFDTGVCFERWKDARRARRASGFAQDGRTATSPARSIPPGGAA
jgi:hypothetical protein